MKKILLSFFGLMFFIACSHKVITATSPAATAVIPVKAMPGAKEIYLDSIQPVLQAKCTPCHFSDKPGSLASLADFASASKYLDDIILRVQLKPGEEGYMPFRQKKEALTPGEIASLKAWKQSLGK